MDGHFTARSTVVEGWVKDALDFWKQNRPDDEESTRITNVYKNSNNKNKGFGTTGKKKTSEMFILRGLPNCFYFL